MLKIKPNIVYDYKKNAQGVILSVKDFEKMIDLLEEHEDYLFVKNYKRNPNEKLFTLEEVKAELSGTRK